MVRETDVVEREEELEIEDLGMSDDVQKVADKVISQENLKFMNAKIGYMVVRPYISKTTLAKCIRTNKELNFFSKFDYIIEVSGDVWNNLDEKQKYVLMFHELLHIEVVVNKKGVEKYVIRDHSIKDFHSVIRKYGVDWFESLKNTASTALDLEGPAIDKLKL